jgi:hypothetical protein
VQISIFWSGLQPSEDTVMGSGDANLHEIQRWCGSSDLHEKNNV